jgi:hypothetical protein
MISGPLSLDSKFGVSQVGGRDIYTRTWSYVSIKRMATTNNDRFLFIIRLSFLLFYNPVETER